MMQIRTLALQRYLFISGTDDVYSITEDHEFAVAMFATGDAALSAFNLDSGGFAQAGFIEYRVWDDETRVDRVVPVPTELFHTPGTHITDRHVHSITTTVAGATEGDWIEAGGTWKILMIDKSRP
jgi:hypothetical protein